MQIKANRDTWLKLKEEQSVNLTDLEKHQVKAGESFTILASRTLYRGHQYVTFDRGYGPENRNSWYIFAGDFDNPPSGKLEATFTPKGIMDEYGCHLYNLLMEMDGLIWRFECGSGQPGHQPVPIASDWAGSMNPIPQGVYTIGTPVYEDERSADPGIGPIWIPLNPHQWMNGRAGFLIHMDWNWKSSPGTAGCIFPTKNRDMQTIADICAKATEGTLHVSYKL